MGVTKNDNAILKLKAQVDKKRAELKKAQRFTPFTNCHFSMEGVTANLQALDKPSIVQLLIKLNAYRLSAVDLNMVQDFDIAGFHISDWIADLKAKLAYMNRKEEERKLALMEDKLQQLLSNEKKVELELDDLAKELSGI